MFERERTEPQTDIDFDFFDDSPTVEESPRETVAPPKRRRRLPTRPPTDGTSGLFRLAILIGAAILFAVILVLWVNSCRAGQKREEYQNYMEAVASRATQSEQIGGRLNTLLTTPGIKLEDLRSELDGLRQEQAQVVASARELKPPGPLREEQESLVEALQFRVSGLDGLAQAFGQVLQSPDADTAGRILAIPAQRLVASDVVYEDLFKAGATDVLSSEGVTGVTVPDSNFVKTAELSSPTSWKLIVDRLTQSPEAGGLHGNQISAVFIQPGDQQLSPSEDNTVRASESLAFQVQIMNSGDSQETQVQVTFTIQQSPTPIRKRATIAIINPQETKTVTFRDLGTVQFATRTTVKVNVEPVQGETNTGNNTAEYPVIFTLE